MNEEAHLPEGDGVDPFLEAYLQPFRGWLDQPDVTELLVNRPGEVWIEQRGRMTRHEAPKVDDSLLQRLNQEYKKTIVMVTHDPHAAERATRVLHLEKGTLVEQTPALATP